MTVSQEPILGTPRLWVGGGDQMRCDPGGSSQGVGRVCHESVETTAAQEDYR
jgi:hypothetical protein